MTGWRGTDALFRGAVCGVGLVGAGVLLHRVELILIGAPLLLATVLGVRRPTEAPSVLARPMPRTTELAEQGRFVVDLRPGPDAELVALRLPRSGRVGPGVVHLLGARRAAVHTTLRWREWGDGVASRVDHLVAGPDGLVVFGPVLGAEGRRVVLPPVRSLPPGPLPPRVAGLVGAHRSARPGDGTELRAIRPFQAGDRLRRVDWRVSLRAAAANGGQLLPATLHVRERHAEADADLVVAIDTRVDVDADLAGWSVSTSGSRLRAAGSVDVAVRAATALAAGYLRQGDRVGLMDLARPQLGLPPAAGRRQLLRLRHQLVVCGRAAGWTTRGALAAQHLPSGALVVVLSPFLDDRVVDLAVRALRRGNRVLAVNTLPGPLVADRQDRWGEAVRAIVAGEHRARLAALRAAGVPTVDWNDGAEVATVLGRLRRTAGRLGVRR